MANDEAGKANDQGDSGRAPFAALLPAYVALAVCDCFSSTAPDTTASIRFLKFHLPHSWGHPAIEHLLP